MKKELKEILEKRIESETTATVLLPRTAMDKSLTVTLEGRAKIHSDLAVKVAHVAV
jgi:hypothetical protein